MPPGLLVHQLRSFDLTAIDAVSLERDVLDRATFRRLEQALLGIDVALCYPDGRLVAYFDFDADSAECRARLDSILGALLPRCSESFFLYQPWPPPYHIS